ncbi:MAG: hypothetical protein WEA35_08470 [Candidatus Nanopelagicales bacterium]
MAEPERIYIRLDPDKLSDDAIDAYAEQLWQAITARMKGAE